MASNPDIFLQGLIGTTGLRPQQELQIGQQQIQQGGQQLAMGQLALQAEQQKAAREQAFQKDATDYFSHPSLENLNTLAIKYPEHAEQLKQVYSSMDASARTSRQEQFGGLWAAANSGRTDLLTKQLQALRTAEQAKQIDTSETDDMLEQLASQDPAVRAAAVKQIKGFAQLHLAAIDPAKFADTYGALNKGQEGFTLSQGQTRFNADGSSVASLAPKPDYLVLPEGATAVPLNGAPALNVGGGDQTAAASAGGDIVARMIPITLGTEGGGSLANPKVSPKGARGPMQVMPGTNLDPGFGVRAAADGSEEERARVGRDYLSAMMQRYGDPAKAWAAYNAGPARVDRVIAANGPRWLSGLPDETRKYVARNMVQLQSGAQAAPQPQGAYTDANGVMHGAPKRGYRLLTPQELPQGLDPSVTYQQGPDGQISPVGGQRQQQIKQIPPAVEKQTQPLVDTRDSLNRALSGFRDEYGGHTFLGEGSNTLQAYTGLGATGQRDWWADFHAADNVVRNQLFGSALTAQEKAAYEGTTISPSMNPTQIRENLRRRLAIVDAAVARRAGYLKANKYDPDAVDALLAPLGMGQAQPAKAAAPAGQPVRVRSIQEAQRLPPGTVFITPTGQRRVRK